MSSADRLNDPGHEASAWPVYGVVIPVRRPPSQFRQHIARVHDFLSESGLTPFEILLVPNSAAGDTTDKAHEWCRELAAAHTGVRWVPHYGRAGKGAALKTGIRAARGRYLFFTDADLPYALDFFVHAAELLEDGVGLVVGNRRSPKSWFEVPVPLLRLTYGRHRLSLIFNRMVRWLLPIKFVDTQAGIKAMSREFAHAVFSKDICPGFFFDLELFLVGHEQNLAMADLPVHFTQRDEATTVRLVRQSMLGVYWLLRIKFRHLRGYYARAEPLEDLNPAEAVLDTH